MNKHKPITILSISGSLRTNSSNSLLLKAIAGIADDNINFIQYDELGLLPHFNPDLDVEPFPVAVTTFRNLLKKADAVIICTPEYAFGPPGVLKNALDWTVSSGEFTKKPLALISASPLYLGGDKAHAAIALTMKALDALLPEKNKLCVPVVYKKFNEQGELIDAETANLLKKVLHGLVETVNADKLINL